jgi:hypothetical protein
LHKVTRTALTLEKRMATLRALLARGANEYRLLKAAAKVRDARIRVLRAKAGTVPSVLRTADQNQRAAARLDAAIEVLRATPPAAILAEFQAVDRPIFPRIFGPE